MSRAYIPDIESLHDFVSDGADEEVHVYIHEEDPERGPVIHPSHALVQDIVTRTLKDLDAPPDPNLDRLCIAVGRRVAGRIARSQGLTVESSDGSKRVFRPEGDEAKTEDRHLT